VRRVGVRHYEDLSTPVRVLDGVRDGAPVQFHGRDRRTGGERLTDGEVGRDVAGDVGDVLVAGLFGADIDRSGSEPDVPRGQRTRA
jgi:hypothetical protein